MNDKLFQKFYKNRRTNSSIASLSFFEKSIFNPSSSAQKTSEDMLKMKDSHHCPSKQHSHLLKSDGSQSSVGRSLFLQNAREKEMNGSSRNSGNQSQNSLKGKKLIITIPPKSEEHESLSPKILGIKPKFQFQTTMKTSYECELLRSSSLTIPKQLFQANFLPKQILQSNESVQTICSPLKRKVTFFPQQEIKESIPTNIKSLIYSRQTRKSYFLKKVS
jgi:hypothetical protein